MLNSYWIIIGQEDDDGEFPKWEAKTQSWTYNEDEATKYSLNEIMNFVPLPTGTLNVQECNAKTHHPESVIIPGLYLLTGEVFS